VLVRPKKPIKDKIVGKWLQEFKVKSTKQNYLSSLRNFKKNLGIKSLDDYIKNNPDGTAEITAKYIGLPKKIQKRCTNRLSWEIGWEEQDLQSMHITAGFLKDFGKIKKVPDFHNFIDC